MSTHTLVCGCEIQTDSVGHMWTQCRLHENAHRLLNVLTRLARGSRISADEVSDVLAECGVSLLGAPVIGEPIGGHVGLERSLTLHNQSLAALLQEPSPMTFNKRQSELRTNVRILLRQEIAALEALKKEREGKSVVSPGGDQHSKVG